MNEQHAPLTPTRTSRGMLSSTISSFVGGGEGEEIGGLPSRAQFFLASYGLLICIGVGENATYNLERPIRVPNPSLL